LRTRLNGSAVCFEAIPTDLPANIFRKKDIPARADEAYDP
jgi:hypothetical protein